MTVILRLTIPEFEGAVVLARVLLYFYKLFCYPLTIQFIYRQTLSAFCYLAYLKRKANEKLEKEFGQGQ